MVSAIIYRYVVFKKSGWFTWSEIPINKESKTPIRFQETEISFVQEVYMVLWNHSFGSAHKNSCSMKDIKFYVKELIFKTQTLSKLESLCFPYFLSGMKSTTFSGFWKYSLNFRIKPVIVFVDQWKQFQVK